ncbi:sucrose-6-phosphate hydrolase [Thorsellia kenyensis]|uniref:Sucrose-6-phosphate hydrolase n=1 Tax=Thorsellia kenyensis TaxID=1549888 RepID=A0ABV6C9Y5_9GAMM
MNNKKTQFSSINQKIEWDREIRYTPLTEVSAFFLETLKTRVTNAPWRLGYHIQPTCGLMNDPNGFCFFAGYYHLFYQWFPLGPVHGLKHWYHVKSKNLIDWIDCGVALVPNEAINSHGAYSGSAFILNEELHFFYTANRRDTNWQRSCSQVIAKLDSDGFIYTVNEAISSIPSGYTEHFRDPKVWYEDNTFYAIIGAQSSINYKGTAVIYSSRDGIEWKMLGEIQTQLDDFGYMWECPDYFTLDFAGETHGILIFSPQGIEAQEYKYQNIYQSGYIVGSQINLHSLSFVHGEFEELDFGFDFYAPQTTTAPDGRRILFAWMGLPEIAYPTDKDGWAHCMTLPRELYLCNGKIVQKPIKELVNLRKNRLFHNEIVEDTFLGRCQTFELEASCLNGFTNFQLVLYASSPEFNASKEENTQQLILRYDAKIQCFIIDRTNAGIVFATEYGTTRKLYLSKPLTHIQVFGDYSSLEVFINEGESVASLRHFPSFPENNNLIWNGRHAKMTLWQY